MAIASIFGMFKLYCRHWMSIQKPFDIQWISALRKRITLQSLCRRSFFGALFLFGDVPPACLFFGGWSFFCLEDGPSKKLYKIT